MVQSLKPKAGHLKELAMDISQCNSTYFLQGNGSGPVENRLQYFTCSVIYRNTQHNQCSRCCNKFNKYCLNMFTYHCLVQIFSVWLCTDVYDLRKYRGRSKQKLSFPFSCQIHLIFDTLLVVRASRVLQDFKALRKSIFVKLAECSYIILLFLKKCDFIKCLWQVVKLIIDHSDEYGFAA